ncbi:hypothetical protein ABZ635_06305 [Nocardiopsis sp. NPDC007018]|uniref:hypothetical protein n=1 Tax=Nocardiopsis sp. NPDC007018 TaxID=3155721 RepID=UPI0033D5A1D5
MSTTETPDPIHVVVLHSEQPITEDLAELHPDRRVTVLTDGAPGEVGDGAELVDVVSMPRAEWTDQLARWARGGEVDVVSADATCQEECDALRAGLGLEPRPAAPADR